MTPKLAYRVSNKCSWKLWGRGGLGMPWFSSTFPRLTDVQSILVEGNEGGREEKERSWQTGFTQMRTPRCPGEFLSSSDTDGLQHKSKTLEEEERRLNRPLVQKPKGKQMPPPG